MSEQSRAFLSDRDHSLLIDIFYKLIGNSEDPAEVQSIESLIQICMRNQGMAQRYQMQM